MTGKLLKVGLCSSEKIGGVSVFAEHIFVRLLLATCPLGRCPWDPDWIRTHALPNRPRTRPTAIAEALDALLSARLIARYHAPDGTPYLLIPNHGQRFKFAVRSPWPAPPDDPPAESTEEDLKRRGEGAPKARDTSPTPSVPTALPIASTLQVESDAEWLDRVQREWPDVDVSAQLSKAHQKRRGDVERGWFEKSWLPHVTPTTLRPAAHNRLAPEPTRWREILEELYPGNAINRDETGWSTIPDSIRSEITTAIASGNTPGRAGKAA